MPRGSVSPEFIKQLHEKLADKVPTALGVERLKPNWVGLYPVEVTEERKIQVEQFFDDLLDKYGEPSFARVNRLTDRHRTARAVPATEAEFDNGKNKLSVWRLTATPERYSRPEWAPIKATFCTYDKQRKEWRIEQSLLVRDGGYDGDIGLPEGRQDSPTTQEEVQTRFETFMQTAEEIVRLADQSIEQAPDVGKIALRS